LQKTGASADCTSQWAQDAIHDMVGNLDEWVESEDGLFVGGFYSRGTREGCDAAVSSHPPEYYDYSLGARCCRPLQ
jgi:formylglycine-generating enzyme required for sulfatase activity